MPDFILNNSRKAYVNNRCNSSIGGNIRHIISSHHPDKKINCNRHQKEGGTIDGTDSQGVNMDKIN